MSDPMQEIRDSFFIECEELLESLQDALAEMEGGANDVETINVAFRAVHSIKGGAGAFGLDQLVGFAHKFETAMDGVRSGDIAVDAEIVSLFFQCGDVLSDVVRASRDGEELAEDQLAGLLTQLSALAEEEEEDEEVDFTPAGLSLDIPGLPDLPDLPPLDGDDAGESPAEAVVGDGPMTIRFVPEPELYKSGNEPFYLLRALAGLGEARISCDVEEVPDLAEVSPETSVLAWTIDLETDMGEEAVREIFDFVDGLCTLDIRPAEPRSPDPDPGGSDEDAVDGPVEEKPVAADEGEVAPESNESAAAAEATPKPEPARPAPKPKAAAGGNQGLRTAQQCGWIWIGSTGS